MVVNNGQDQSRLSSSSSYQIFCLSQDDGRKQRTGPEQIVYGLFAGRLHCLRSSNGGCRLITLKYRRVLQRSSGLGIPDVPVRYQRR
jgi:hypothetical protein